MKRIDYVIIMGFLGGFAR